jgi:penicillin amidase
MIDPPEGAIVSANDGLLAAMLTEHLISTDFHAPTRALRIRELLDARRTHDVASFAAIQRDTVSLAARAAAPALVAHTTPSGAAARTALDLLAGWDHDLGAGSQAAAVYEVWTEAIARRALAARVGDDVFRAYAASAETWKGAVLPSLLEDPRGWLDDDLLAGALDDALEELGDPIPTWGELHRLVLAHPLARIPGLEPLFVAADEPLGGDEHTVAAAGMDGVAGRTAAVVPSIRMIWDLAAIAAGAEGSVMTLPSGVSGNPASPHWNDQTTAFMEGVGPRGTAPAGGLTLAPP